jgi:hypothetical protein
VLRKNAVGARISRTPPTPGCERFFDSFPPASARGGTPLRMTAFGWNDGPLLIAASEDEGEPGCQSCCVAKQLQHSPASLAARFVA